MKLNKILTILILLMGSRLTIAQTPIYELHPVVGDTIDNNEIRKYYLFPDDGIDSLDYLIINKNTDSYTLIGFSNNKQTLELNVSQEKISFQKKQIEKLNNYYLSLEKKDSSDIEKCPNKRLISDTLKNIDNIDLKYKTPAFLKSIQKEIRKESWEENRKEKREDKKRRDQLLIN